MEIEPIEIELSNGARLTATASDVVVENGSDYGTYVCVLQYGDKSACFGCVYAVNEPLNLLSGLAGFIYPVLWRDMGVIMQSETEQERINAFEQLFGVSEQSNRLAKELQQKIVSLQVEKSLLA